MMGRDKHRIRRAAATNPILAFTELAGLFMLAPNTIQ